MKKFLVGLSLVLLTAACGVDQKLQNANLGDLSETLDKAVDDTKDEGKRFNDYLIEKTHAADEKLVKANEDFTDEEHRFNQRVKDTGKKANMDVLDEEARTTGRTKDTLAKANSDFNDEEHRFNDNFKDTTSKANGDFNSEKERLKDSVLGTDEEQIESNDRRITDLERRMALVEQLNDAQGTLLSIYFDQMRKGDEQGAKDLFDLRTDLSALQSRVNAAESDILVLQALSDGLRTDLSILQSDVDAAEQDILDNSEAIESLYDQINGEDGVLDRLSETESDIEDLQEQTKKLRKKLKKLKNYVHGCLENRLDALESAVNASCTLQVSEVESFPVSKCTNVIGWGFCGVNQSRTLYSATLTLQCLGKPAQYIDNVLFETNPTL